jgi:prepilin-type N-terminal cleavage/methylation domain-containing protein
MDKQAGLTLLELMVVMVISGLIIAAGSLFTVSAIASETMRSTLHDAGGLLQMARIEAVKRTHECRFVVDPTARTMSVVDTNGTSTSTDDVVLRVSSIPQVVALARPDVGSPITFSPSGSTYVVNFDQDGYVNAGSGEMVLFGGERYDRLTVYAAGGVRYEKWNGSAWVPGS